MPNAVATATASYSFAQLVTFMDWMFDQTPQNVTAHSFTLSGVFGGSSAVATVAGNFAVAGGMPVGGTILGVSMRVGGVLQGTISTSISLASVQAAINAEDNGNPAAIETLLLGINWTYNGTAVADIAPAGSFVGDHVAFNMRGNDVIRLNGGNDNFYSGSGNDVLDGGIGNDILNAGAGNDTLIGGAGNDTLVGGAGNDRLNGGQGVDTVNYGAEGGPRGVRVNLLGNGSQGGLPPDTAIDSFGNTDRVVGIPNVIGTQFADVIFGGNHANVLSGGGGHDMLNGGLGADSLIGGLGNDRLLGGAGNDILIGGLGRDVQTGGANDDIFRFTALSHSVITNPDVITDFDDFGNDRIDVSLLFGPAMAYRHNLAFTAAGQVRINDIAGADLLVEVNTGGTLAADFAIRLTGTTLGSMGAGDFIL